MSQAPCVAVVTSSRCAPVGVAAPVSCACAPGAEARRPALASAAAAKADRRCVVIRSSRFPGRSTPAACLGERATPGARAAPVAAVLALAEREIKTRGPDPTEDDRTKGKGRPPKRPFPRLQAVLS